MRKQLALEWWIFVFAIAAGLIYLAAPLPVIIAWLLAQTPIVVVWQIIFWQRRADQPTRPVIVIYQPPISVDVPHIKLLEHTA